MRILPMLVLALATGTAAAADEFPTGTFTLKATDGMWAVTFDGKGKYTVTHDGKERVNGSYKVTKDEIALTDKPPPGAGKGPEAIGTYK